MEVMTVKTKSQQYAMTKDIAKIFGYKDPAKLLKEYREFADSNPNVFKPYRPYIKNKGMDTLYDIICFAYFFENKDLLKAGTRSIHFKKELPRLKEVYQS